MQTIHEECEQQVADKQEQLTQVGPLVSFDFVCFSSENLVVQVRVQ